MSYIKSKSGECSKTGNQGISGTPGNGTETGRKDDNAYQKLMEGRSGDM